MGSKGCGENRHSLITRARPFPLWVTGCRCDHVSSTTGVPQKAANLGRCQSRQPWAIDTSRARSVSRSDALAPRRRRSFSAQSRRSTSRSPVDTGLAIAGREATHVTGVDHANVDRACRPIVTLRASMEVPSPGSSARRFPSMIDLLPNGPPRALNDANRAAVPSAHAA
jgi:hypothetical protein